MAHKSAFAPAETLSGDRVLTTAEVRQYRHWTFDPAGARDLTLPDAADVAGEEITVSNTANAAEIITIKADSATVCTPTQNEDAILWSNGTAWRGGVVAHS